MTNEVDDPKAQPIPTHTIFDYEKDEVEPKVNIKFNKIN